MGHDFSDVRVHNDASAHRSAQSIAAHAYTFGHHIAFAHGQYNPDSDSGRRLLSHELTHVVQQKGGGRTVQRDLDPRQAEILRSLRAPGQVALNLGLPAFSLHHFAINDATLKGHHTAFLDELAHLAMAGRIQNLRLIGHADATGDDVVNGPLSRSRAEAVQAYLSASGVSVASVVGGAASLPVRGNGSEAGRARNRRVDIRFEWVAAPTPEPPLPQRDSPPERDDPPQPPKVPPEEPPGIDWPDFDFCADHPIICGIVGVGVLCALFPKVCAVVIPWPDWPGWPGWPGWPDFDDEPEPPDPENEPLQCGDATLPLTNVRYIPQSGDKGVQVIAEPLTRCEGNTRGSVAKNWNKKWPHGWDCVNQRGQGSLWARAHLLHGPTKRHPNEHLHGPGNDRQNIILADKSLNTNMTNAVEGPAVALTRANQVLWYEVTANHFSGDYPRPYFAEGFHMRYGLLDPISRVRGPAIFSGPINSGINRVPPECDADQEDDTPQQDQPPVPEADTAPDAQQICDESELARRVDHCIEAARRGILLCGLDAAFLGGGLLGGLRGYRCLDEVREALLECDRQAKAETNCPDLTTMPDLPLGDGDQPRGFDSTLQICRRLLDSRPFYVSGGRAQVLIDADWLDELGNPATGNSCPMDHYHVSLEQSRLLIDHEISTAVVPVGKATSITWSGLDDGNYYLKLWTDNNNPTCCLTGTIRVNLN